MSTDRETPRIVRSWLEAGVTALPDRVLDAVLDQLPATPQRRPPWPARRTAQMNKILPAAVAAAAVLVVAIVGYNLLPGTMPGAIATSIPTSVASVSPTRPPASLAPMIEAGPVPPGTYSIASESNTRFTVTVPSGWSYDGGALSKGDAFFGNGVAFAPWIVTHVYRDSCDWQGTLTEVHSKDELVALLRAIKPFRNIQAPDTLIGRAPNGYPAAAMQFSLGTDADLSACDEGFARLWPNVGGSESGGLPIHVGHTISVWVIETSGKATALVAIQNADSDPTAVAELRQIVNSIRIPG